MDNLKYMNKKWVEYLKTFYKYEPNILKTKITYTRTTEKKAVYLWEYPLYF